MTNVSGAGGSKNPIQILETCSVQNPNAETLAAKIKELAKQVLTPTDITVNCISDQGTDPSRFEVLADGKYYTAAASTTANVEQTLDAKTLASVQFTFSLVKNPQLLTLCINTASSTPEDIQSRALSYVEQFRRYLFQEGTTHEFNKDKSKLTINSKTQSTTFKIVTGKNSVCIYELETEYPSNRLKFETTIATDSDHANIQNNFISAISPKALEYVQEYPQGRPKSFLRMVKNFCRQYFKRRDSYNKSVYKSLLKQIKSKLPTNEPRTRLQLGLIGYRAFCEHKTDDKHTFTLDDLEIVEKSFIRGSLPKKLKKDYDKLTLEQRKEFILQLEPHVNLNIEEFQTKCSELFTKLLEKKAPPEGSDVLLTGIDYTTRFLYESLSEVQKKDYLAFLQEMLPSQHQDQSFLKLTDIEYKALALQVINHIKELPKYKNNQLNGYVTDTTVDSDHPQRKISPLALAILQKCDKNTTSTEETSIVDLTQALLKRMS